MRFVSVRELRNSTAQVWRDLEREGEIVVMNGSAPQALLVSVTGENLESTARAIRQARAFQALDSMNAQAAARGLDTMTMAEIDAEIAAVRGERHGAQ